MVRELTLDALLETMRQCAGETDAGVPDADLMDVPFLDVGYDSLALLETAARIEREYGISLSDDTVVTATTPRVLLRIVNQTLGLTHVE
jgi:act minimal PKS acyl carrier protein